MVTTNPVAVTFEHILVATDFSDISQRALEYAKTIAKQKNSELLLVHVSPPVNLITPPEGAWIDECEVQRHMEERLEQSGAALRSEGYRARAISITGALYDELISAINQYKVDLIVLGTHGKRGLERLLLGSDTEAVYRHARCPVLCVGPAVPDLQGKAWNVREVICATDFDPRSAEVAAYAHKIAALEQAELVLFHVKNANDQEDVNWASFEEAFDYYVPEGLGRRSWLRTRLASASPGTSIVDLAKQRGSDLIVMGAHPASYVTTHLAAGTTAKVLADSPCPVLTVLLA
jgi:nucleotide-binding universal stress UspA family protein